MRLIETPPGLIILAIMLISLVVTAKIKSRRDKDR
jgi:hypothetical protein